MGLSRTVSEIKGDFSRKVQIFSYPPFTLHPAEWVPLGIGYQRSGSKTTIMGLRGRERSWGVWLIIKFHMVTHMGGGLLLGGRPPDNKHPPPYVLPT